VAAKRGQGTAEKVLTWVHKRGGWFTLEPQLTPRPREGGGGGSDNRHQGRHAQRQAQESTADEGRPGAEEAFRDWHYQEVDRRDGQNASTLRRTNVLFLEKQFGLQVYLPDFGVQSRMGGEVHNLAQTYR